jgi:hypothetical protein
MYKKTNPIILKATYILAVQMLIFIEIIRANAKSLKYILRAIVMLFLRAKVIPVNLHANIMRPMCVLNFIFEPLFVHVLDTVDRFTNS